MKKILSVALALALVSAGVFAQATTTVSSTATVTAVDVDVPRTGTAQPQFLRQGFSGQVNLRTATDNVAFTLGLRSRGLDWSATQTQANLGMSFNASTDNAGLSVSLSTDWVNLSGLTQNNQLFRSMTSRITFGAFNLTFTTDASRFSPIHGAGFTAGIWAYRGISRNDDTRILSLNQDGGNMAAPKTGVATLADYTFDLGFANLLIKGSLLRAPGAITEANYYVINSRFGAEAALSNDLFNIDVVYKLLGRQEQTVGLYAWFTPAGIARFGVGGTGYLNFYNSQPTTLASMTTIMYGIDGRVVLAPDPLSVTVAVNFSGGNNATVTRTVAGVAATTANTTTMSLMALASVSYRINSVFTVSGSVDFETAQSTGSMTSGGRTTTTTAFAFGDAMQTRVTAGLAIAPFEHVVINVGPVLDIYGVYTEATKQADFSLPISFTVSF